MLLHDCDPTPPYYEHTPSPSPHPFMGLGEFVAWRIHQMRAAKSYLAAHPSWIDENPDSSCLRCGTEPEPFEHAILTCSTQATDRDLLLKEVASLGQDPPLWTEPSLVQALCQYISATKTTFSPDMSPDYLTAPALSSTT